MRAKVDRKACGGTGLCMEICPMVFAQDPDYIAYVKEDGTRVDGAGGAAVPENEAEAIQEAVEACPTGAITAEDETSELS
jgi:ferredoxin